MEEYTRLMAEYDCPSSLLEHANAFIEKYPNRVSPRILKGRALMELGLFKESIRELKAGARISPERHSVRFWEWIGLAYDKKGDHTLAETWFARCVERAPNTTRLIFLGACLFAQGKYEEAKPPLRRACKRNEGAPEEAHLNLALIFRAQGNLKQALEHANKAIALDPEYDEAERVREDCQRALQFRSKSS